jgi:hypothetical protein
VVSLWHFAYGVAHEPAYQGKVLTVWLRSYDPSLAAGRGSLAWSAADDAVRNIGTNCIPILLRMLRERDSKLTLSLVALARKQRVIPIHFVSAEVHNVEASRAFIVLGGTAKDAVPELMRAYEANSSSESRNRIAESLGWIGPGAEPAVPLLLHGASDSEARVRASLLWALGEIHARPEVCVRVLTGALNDSNSWCRLSAVHALGAFGADAQQGVPALSEMTNSPPFSGVFRAGKAQECSEARKALQKILGGEDAPLTGLTLESEAPAGGRSPLP